MKNTIQTKLNINPKSLNRNSTIYVYVRDMYQGNSSEKTTFKNLQLKRSFSKMPFFEMPYYTMIIYVLTLCLIYAIIV